MEKLPVAPGDIVADKYRIERLIGRGGMGSVFQATHTQILQRVALKFLSAAALHREELRARFLREARAAAALTSEHVARVLDVGVLPNGVPFLVIEYLDGRDLGARIEEGPMPVDEAVKLLLQACDALGEAHRMGIVHRDVKPHNIFLVKRPTGATLLKVLDFGIAKTEDPELRANVTTGTCTVMGTPHYMAPEQMTSTRSVDPAADVWGLGVMFYEMLTQHRPFESATLLELGALVLTGAPTPITAYRPDVPSSVIALIERCLSKDPTRRFADANELHNALEGVLKRNAIVVAPPTMVTPRHPTPLPPSPLGGMGPPTPGALRLPGTIVSPAHPRVPTPTPRGIVPMTSVSFGDPNNLSAPPPPLPKASSLSMAVPLGLVALVFAVGIAAKYGGKKTENATGDTSSPQVSAPPPPPVILDVPPPASVTAPPPSIVSSSIPIPTTTHVVVNKAKPVRPVTKPTTTGTAAATEAPAQR